MNHRARVLMALQHKESDRVPIDFIGLDCSGIHITTYNRLRERLGVAPGTIRLGSSIMQIAEPEPEVQDCFDGDVSGLFFHPRQWQTWDSPWGVPVLTPELWRPERLENGDMVVRDGQGIVRSWKPRLSFYFDPTNPPLAGIATPADLSRFDTLFERWDWPAALDETVEEYGRRARKQYQSTDRAVIALWGMHILQSGQLLRGYEQFLMDLLVNEPLVHAIFEKMVGVYLARAEKFIDALKDSIDAILLLDDLGGQTGPLIDPRLFRRLVKPYTAELVSFVKKRSGRPVILHSCGSVRQFIPDIIELGFDALNPVQISARDMDPRELKREFGKDIAFWGGGCNTQQVLNLGTPEQVREDVKRNIEALAPGGGFVFTQVHAIQAGTSLENIMAMFETAHEFGKY